MVKHTVAVELFYDSIWNDHTTDVRQTSPLSLKSGVSDPSQEATPAAATLVFENASGNLNPMNPNGTLVGKIGQNTPVRITLDSDARFYGEVASWKPRRDIKGNARVEVTCAGILRRFGRGVDPLHS